MYALIIQQTEDTRTKKKRTKKKPRNKYNINKTKQWAKDHKKQKKQDQEKIKKRIQRNKTKPGAKNHKTQNTKITKGGEPGSPVVRRLLCTVLLWGGCYVLSCCGEAAMYCPPAGSGFVLFVEGLCVTWLLPLGVGEINSVRILWLMIEVCYVIVLNIMGRLRACFVLTCVWCSCVFFCGWGVSSIQ